MKTEYNSFRNEGVGALTLATYKKIPKGRRLIIALPAHQAMLCGVSRFEIARTGEVAAVYQDGMREMALLSDEQLLGAENAFALTRLVQETARKSCERKKEDAQ